MRIRWHVRTVETAGQSTWSSLAFSPSGQPAIAYYSSLNSALRFATLNPDGSWAISTVDTVASDCKPSLAFRSGRPAISYRVGANEFWGALRFALYTGGSSPWSISSVAPYGNASSLAFDSSQRAGISYYDPISRTLKFARQGSPAPSNWVTETVDPQQNAGDFNALAFTPLSGEPSAPPGDRPVIAYHDQAHNHIKLARFVGTAWDIETLRQGTNPNLEQGLGWCSLGFWIAGFRPSISFTGINNNVRYARYSINFYWSVSTIPGGITGSLAHNSLSSRPWELGIAYTPGHIVLAYGGNYSFRHWLVDEAGKDQLGNFVGPFELPSLAFSPSGHPGISYYDSANSTIKYAAGTIVRMPLDAFFDFLDFLMQGVRQATRRVRSSLSRQPTAS